MTGRPGYRTMEMIGGSSAPYLARTPCVPLFCTSFNRVGNKERLDYQGRAGDHFHCAVECSPGHIRCRKKRNGIGGQTYRGERGRKLLGPAFGRTGFSRRIFSPHFCGKKCPEKSSRKIPGKILQHIYTTKILQHISADWPGQKLFSMNQGKTEGQQLEGKIVS